METAIHYRDRWQYGLFSYSLGDAIDWKLYNRFRLHFDILDLLLARGRDRLETRYTLQWTADFRLSYSLGDAIDWKLGKSVEFKYQKSDLLLARGRDRLETSPETELFKKGELSPTR